MFEKEHEKGVREARFWKRIGDSKVQCTLCPTGCKIGEGNLGVCGVRRNIGGKLSTLVYGLASSVMNDPIEKKPLFHFYPGSSALSFGTVGCNFSCEFCQNYTISQAKVGDIPLRSLSPEEVVQLVERYHSGGVAWTYNEPTIWHEFTYDASKLVKKKGFYSVYVTNGYINEEPLRELSPYLDAMNIDLKSISDDFYRKLCRGRRDPVLDTCKLAKELGIHLELTNLVIPGYNDDPKEIRELCKWVVENLGTDVPLHFSRFHPDYNMREVPSTPLETLSKAYDIATEEGLRFIYLGNIPHDERENTYCPNCGRLVIERWGFSVGLKNLKDGSCAFCGEDLNIVT